MDREAAQRVVDLIQGSRSSAGKWTLPVLAALESGPSRHNQLRRAVDGGIRAKVFEDTIRRLVEDQLVRRHLTDTSPPAVVFTLTPLGEDLLELLSVMATWAHDHVIDLPAGRRGG